MKHIYAPGYKLFQFTSITVNEAIPSNYQRILLVVFNGTFSKKFTKNTELGNVCVFQHTYLKKICIFSSTTALA